jgi:hypothetical protein
MEFMNRRRPSHGGYRHRHGWFLCTIVASLLLALPLCASESKGHRVIVSTDIGGTDPDDFQSMVHLLLYADTLDIEGLVSSPFGPGRKQDILDVIDIYALDYDKLRTHSDRYPSPEELRAITKQGAIEHAPYRGYREPTEGSRWIVDMARKDDPRPLHLLVWGGIEDLAQALHDAPDILPRLRVYYIGGPNKKWGPDAYQYLADHHPELWIIESNATYRGWFVGGKQDGEWGNEAFVTQHIAGRGALGEYFATHLEGVIKMGDTPSVGRLLRGTPSDPSQPGWGGRFVRAWERPYQVFTRLTSGDDGIEEFGVVELQLPLGPDAPEQPVAHMNVENQSLEGFVDGEGDIRFRFSPKRRGRFEYTIEGNVPSLDGLAGGLEALPTPPDAAMRPDPKRPNWWTDDPAPAYAEGPHIGARTVSTWRHDFLADFAARMQRCEAPADAGVVRIMPLGDSITYDNRRGDMRPVGVRIAYRHTLSKLLKDAGYSFDFVGSENAGERYLGSDLDDNAGFPGITDGQLATLIGTGYSEIKDVQLTPGPYLETYPADVILLHIGTNRVEASSDDVENILDDIRRSDPDVFIVVSRIINRYPYHAVTTAFNDKVEAMVVGRGDQRIVMVDMEDGAGIDYYVDMDDDLHPNYLGYDKMAKAWFEALEPILSNPVFTTSTTQ